MAKEVFEITGGATKVDTSGGGGLLEEIYGVSVGRCETEEELRMGATGYWEKLVSAWLRAELTARVSWLPRNWAQVPRLQRSLMFHPAM